MELWGSKFDQGNHEHRRHTYRQFCQIMYAICFQKHVLFLAYIVYFLAFGTVFPFIYYFYKNAKYRSMIENKRTLFIGV